MNRRKVGITAAVTALVICVLALVLLSLGRFIAEHSAVPFQYMWVWFEDERGIATIRSDAFRVAFAARSFGSHNRGGNYLVDGRYGFRLFGGPESAGGEVGDGVTWDYSQRRRLAKFRYQGHEIAYCHAWKKLIVDGQEYSTADGQVCLLVKANGDMELMDKEPTAGEQIATADWPREERFVGLRRPVPREPAAELWHSAAILRSW